MSTRPPLDPAIRAVFDRELTLALVRLSQQETSLLSIGLVHSNAKANGLNALAKISASKLALISRYVNDTRAAIADLRLALGDSSPITAQTDIESEAPAVPLRNGKPRSIDRV